VVDGGHVVLRAHGARLREVERIGQRLACALRPGDLVLVYGPLGAGKTTLVRAVAHALGVAEPVRSPSFTIANIYAARLPIQHLDLYRLEEIGDEDAVALEEYGDGEAVTLVEWPDAGSGRLGNPAWVVRLDHETAETREVQVEAVTDDARRRWEETGNG
jgi:tRNA threonylcarbamoyladenosine biosynthesis protein TsaE